MSGLALGIVLIAAFLHAGWNFLAKRSQKKIVFIWWFLLVALVLYFPMFLYYWPRTTISAVGWSCVAATGFLVVSTYLMVLFAMRMAKVSYVVAVREVSIVFSALYGIFWLKEKHGSQKLVGANLITLGVIFIGLSL